jgi:hypothetical protein
VWTWWAEFLSWLRRGKKNISKRISGISINIPSHWSSPLLKDDFKNFQNKLMRMRGRGLSKSWTLSSWFLILNIPYSSQDFYYP